MNIQSFFTLGMAREIPELIEVRGGLVLNLGAGKRPISGAYNLDLPEWNAEVQPIPAEDGEVDLIHAYHFLEHLEDPVRMLREIERVLRVGGVANISVPYYSSQLAFHDLNHRSFFTEATWDNTFAAPYYDHDGGDWKLRVHFNLIIGLVERNLALLTQLVRVA